MDTRAAADGKINAQARVVWLLECGPIRARCIAAETAYEIQLRGTGGWKTIHTSASPLSSLRRFVTTGALQEAMTASQAQARKVQDGK